VHIYIYTGSLFVAGFFKSEDPLALGIMLFSYQTMPAASLSPQSGP
jgi:hypothetical protein